MSSKSQDAAHARREQASAPSAPAEPVVPEAVVSRTSVPFNADDYESLLLRYTRPRIRENEALPEGMELRRQTAPTIIDQPPYAKLKKTIARLKRSGNDEEVYRLLCELREWEIHGGRIPQSMDQSVGASEVVEVVNLAACEEAEVIDVEASEAQPLAQAELEEESANSNTVATVDDVVPDHANSIPSLDAEPLPDQVPSVTSVVAAKPTKVNEPGKGTCEIVDLMYSSDEEDKDNNGDINVKVKHWTKPEDEVLCALVSSFINDSGNGGNNGTNVDWTVVADRLGPGRSHLQCLERYNKLSRIPNKTRARRQDLAPLPVLLMPPMHSKSGTKRKRNDLSHQGEKISSIAIASPPSLGACTCTTTDTDVESSETLSSQGDSSGGTRAVLITNIATSPTSAVPSGKSDTNTKTSEQNGISLSNASMPPQEEKSNPTFTFKDSDQVSLKAAWNRQSNLRTKGQWKPSGGWTAPAWASQHSTIQTKESKDTAAAAPTGNRNIKSTHKKPAKKRRKVGTQVSCSKKILDLSLSLLAQSLPEGSAAPSEVTNLCQLKCSGYAKTITENLLFRAHRAQQGLLCAEDCDSWVVVKMARAYYDYWRPAKGNIRAILLAESHSKTETDQMTSTILDTTLCPQYNGPRNYIKLVHCAAYGELKCISSSYADKKSKKGASSTATNQNDSGTSQFWTLLAAASRGTEYLPGNVRSGNRGKHAFATDVLKVGGLDVEDRLEAKLSILKTLQDRGIWLIDVSVIGWVSSKSAPLVSRICRQNPTHGHYPSCFQLYIYTHTHTHTHTHNAHVCNPLLVGKYITQAQKFKRSKKTNEVHRMAKERPPKQLKAPSMILSWELFTKHVIRAAAEEGALNLLVLIGKELENILSMERLTEAVTPTTLAAGPSLPHCKIEPIPAPNAWSE